MGNLTAVPLGSDARDVVAAVWMVVPIHVNHQPHHEHTLYRNNADLLPQASISEIPRSILASILRMWMEDCFRSRWIAASTDAPSGMITVRLSLRRVVILVASQG